jgi:hypothetical protein
MTWQKPSPAAVWKAIDAYVAVAYPDRPTATVAARLATLRAVPEHEFFTSAALERTPKDDPTRFDLRLGNQWYPHMKLCIQRSPDGKGHLFCADTHDRHIQPAPGSRDYEAFRELMEKNRVIAAQIESAWEAAGLPTFKSYLRDDLARRSRE